MAQSGTTSRLLSRSPARGAGLAESLLAPAGVAIGGSAPWDIVVHDERLMHRYLAEGTLGLGEAYMDGWWDCDALDEFVARVLRANLLDTARKWSLVIPYARAWLWNLQRKSRAFQIGEAHYDLGNDLFEAMLDSRMVYSCAYWRDAKDLDEAQEQKLELICRKLELQPGLRVLDIGCGWGALARHMAERYKVEVVGITVSKRQVELAEQRCRDLPISFRLQDYRDVRDQFDRVVSVGMIEHVGSKNYRTFMNVVGRCLKSDDGLFLLHTIGRNDSVLHGDPWIDKYIFPNGQIPSIRQLSESMEGLFVVEDWHNIGPHYEPTLMAWYKNFEAAWPRLRDRYGERFRRMWRYYLLTCAGTFRARHNQVWQIVLSRRGIPGGYTSVR